MEFDEDEAAYIVFDDSVLNKEFGPCIKRTRRQWSGNEHGVINDIGLVSWLYVHPGSGRFWVLDYRLYDPDHDGKTKLDHIAEMLQTLRARTVPFGTVLMDSWYATKDLMLAIDGYASNSNSSSSKIFYCPLKSDRMVDDSGGQRPYRHVAELEWSQAELKRGKLIKVRGFPGDYKVKLFWVVVSSRRTEWIVTNDLTQDSTQGAQQACALERVTHL